MGNNLKILLYHANEVLLAQGNVLTPICDSVHTGEGLSASSSGGGNLSGWEYLPLYTLTVWRHTPWTSSVGYTHLRTGSPSTFSPDGTLPPLDTQVKLLIPLVTSRPSQSDTIWTHWSIELSGKKPTGMQTSFGKLHHN